MFHFSQVKNYTCSLAPPLPTKAIRLCGDPIMRTGFAMTQKTIGYRAILSQWRTLA